MGGDSAGSQGTTLTTLREPKVFTVKNKFIIGGTGHPRASQLLKYRLKAPTQKPGQADHEYMCTDFVDAIRKCLFEGGYATKSNEAEEGGNFLVGYKSNIYEVEKNFQIIQRVHDYDAIGCGESFALGAISAVMDVGTCDYDSEQIVEAGLDAAKTFSPQVQEPFHIIKLKAGKRKG
jgi:ATP-dependent protease HslVU (ClpYQ) peptidase subunit